MVRGNNKVKRVGGNANAAHRGGGGKELLPAQSMEGVANVKKRVTGVVLKQKRERQHCWVIMTRAWTVGVGDGIAA